MDNQCSGVTNSGLWSRQTYFGSVIFNLGAFALPALYGTLSKLWVANIDPTQVATTDIYTYIGVIVEVLNESLPRTAWLIIGDSSARTLNLRLNLAYTMILVQTVLGVCMTVIFLACSQSLASGFVPSTVREASITYVRLSSVQAVTSAIEAALSASTRALDNPDVPLIISSAKFAVNILLDLLIISKVHFGAWNPTVVMQAIIRLACDTISALVGLTYFLTVVVRRSIRNATHLWLVHQIVLLGSDYATSWGVFNTIRWGLIMVPVQALEASTLTFVGHNWGAYRAGKSSEQPRASRREILEVTRPSLRSALVVLVFETVTCVVLSLRGIEAFARYLSGSNAVAKITQTMWKSIDWTYIFYGVNCQLAAILLATSPRWYLYQSLGSSFLWMLPWAIVVTTLSLPTASAWTYYAIIFGGALVFDSGCVCFTLTVWACRLLRGKIGLTPGA
ncbi:unnamed protein product [Penicillium salamii]|uniref:Uncharacterized protein n=1 Tax=Penicillium salamii TaxID=1612424 RepID=A0A9W4JLZ8_9EURO|nr:unnamed protein product [Penicillium salamii]